MTLCASKWCHLKHQSIHICEYTRLCKTSGDNIFTHITLLTSICQSIKFEFTPIVMKYFIMGVYNRLKETQPRASNKSIYTFEFLQRCCYTWSHNASLRLSAITMDYRKLVGSVPPTRKRIQTEVELRWGYQRYELCFWMDTTSRLTLKVRNNGNLDCLHLLPLKK